MEKKLVYQSDFYPVYHAINQCIERLDALGVVDLVGDKCARAFADSFVQLVMRTWEACPPDNVFDTREQPR